MACSSQVGSAKPSLNTTYALQATRNLEKQNSNLRESGGFDMYYDSELEMVLIDVTVYD
jgi:hypothetical protein